MSVEHVVRYVDSGGLQIAFQTIGRGTPDLVFVADAGTSLDTLWEHPEMRAFYAQLAAIGRLIVIDPRGVGLSDPMEHLPPLEDWVDDVRVVLDAVGVDRATLIGHGYGGQLCLLFAAVHPDRTTAVVSVNGYARLRRAPDYPAGFPPEAEAAVLEQIQASWGSGSRLAWTSPDTVRNSQDLEWWARCERASATPRRAQVRQAFAFDVDITDVLPAIAVPTLVIFSSDDPYIRRGHAEYLAARVNGARLVEIPGCHSPMLNDAREALVGAVSEMLTGTSYRPPPDRALMTVAFTDIVDSTRRAVELGDRRWRELLQLHDEVSAREVHLARGRVVKFTGDGMMATFDGPARAVHCVRSIAQILEKVGVPVRAGVHTGEVEIRDDDIGGIAVHIAARISALARGGETLVSSTVRDLVAGSGLVFDDHGERVLKGIPDPWRVFAVAHHAP
ncbi:adenylate/guanylate cyclase domain-containing protein [Nocardioides silvaticus]|uniref:Adenylate/guanylate cyclase domain-containing protein n=1 Tax=Nocardioides silvaticus TaxID=2201891 RepID=A0A316TF57_9ACTN|nr:adenylate/guanylate cyclase domain-containing protein [Nocardioides silvaticus]PWN01799.1 adenylate/guanylate cyclase domain-containing protein [Nocardioides silvaticus]